jgi:hypothetical protein
MSAKGKILAIFTDNLSLPFPADGVQTSINILTEQDGHAGMEGCFTRQPYQF